MTMARMFRGNLADNDWHASLSLIDMKTAAVTFQFDTVMVMTVVMTTAMTSVIPSEL